MRKRFPADQWARWFVEFEQSGLCVKEFCELKEIGLNSFYTWRRKLAEPRQTVDSSHFVAVDVQVSDKVEIEMPCGAVARVPNNVDSLRPVFRALVEIGESDS